MRHTKTTATAILLLAAATASCGGDDGDCTATMSCSATSGLVINEMAGTGADFVEVLNNGSAPVDMSGWSISDTSSNGGPRTTDAFRFPAGTVLAAGQYLVLMMESNCPTTLPSTARCFRAEYGLSQSGEMVFLLDASANRVRSEMYPANGAPSGRSYARVPNGTGMFQSSARTPGAANPG